MEVIEIQQDRDSKKNNPIEINSERFNSLQLKSIEKNSIQALCKCGTIYKIVHCVAHQNITMSCYLQYEYILGFFNHYKRNHKNLNLIRKKLGLNHSFASTTLSVEAQIPNVFEKCLEILMFAMD